MQVELNRVVDASFSRARRRFLRSSTALGAAAAAYPMLARAQESGIVKLIMPTAPGGGGDALFRVMEDKLRQALGRPVIIDYKAGGGGAPGHLQVARGPKDGSMLGYAYSGPMSTIPLLRKNVGYDPLKDFEPVSLVMRAPAVVMASMRVPGDDIGALMAYAKTKPEGIICGNAAAGGLGHLTGVLLGLEGNMKMLHVPYKGGAPAIQALMAGDLDIVVTVVTETVLSLAKAQKLKLIGVASKETSQLLPDVPTVAKFLPGFHSEILHGIVLPAGTPREIVEQYNAAFVKVLNDKDIQAKFMANNSIASPSTPQQYRQAIAAEYAQWAQVIKRAGITADQVT